MEHFYNYLQKKKTIDCQGPVKITEKIDGTPLQIVNNDGKFEFHSKGQTMDKPGPLITSLDLYMNPAFYERCKYLKNVLSANSAAMSMCKIINLEIVVENKHHIVQYDSMPKNNMYVLSGTSLNDRQLSQNALTGIAKTLGLEVLPCVILEGRELINQLVDFVKGYGDPKNPKYDDIKFKNKLGQILSKGKGEDFITKTSNVEGIVLEFNDVKPLYLKIDSPYFLNTFKENKDKTLGDKDENSILELVKAAKNLINIDSVKKYSNDPLENLILNFNKTIGSDRKSLLVFAQHCHNCTKSKKDAIVNAIPDKYKPKKFSDDWYLGFQNFAWLFRKNRSGLLKDVNEIVDKIKGK